MAFNIYPDLYTVDRFAEFVHPHLPVEHLYGLDRHGYAHAISSMLQCIVTHARVGISTGPGGTTKLEATSDLKKQLDYAKRVTPGLPRTDRTRRRTKAIKTLRASWPDYVSALRSGIVHPLIIGHLKREFVHYFGSPVKGIISAYLPFKECKRLPKSVHSELIKTLARNPIVKQICSQRALDINGKKVAAWLHACIFTHYVNFLENWHYFEDQYSPGATRANLPVKCFARIEDTGVLVQRVVNERIAAWYAFDIIKKAKSRSDLLKIALGYDGMRHSTAQNFKEFQNTILIGTSEERERMLLKAQKMLDSSLPYSIRLAVYGVTTLSAAFLAQIRAMQMGVGELAKLNHNPKSLRWIWKIGRSDLGELQKKMDKLAKT